MTKIKRTASLCTVNVNYLIDKSFQDHVYVWHSLLVVTTLTVKLQIHVIHHILQTWVGF